MSAKSKVPQIRFSGFSGKWNSKKLDNIATFFSGGTPTSTNKSYYNGTIPFIGSGKISSSSVEQFITNEALENSSAKMVNKGDLLYALYGATSGEVAISKINGAINQAVLCLRTQEDKYFLFKWFVLNKKRILSTYLQGGQGNLSAQIIKDLNVYFPKQDEQIKIANYFKQLDILIEQKEKKYQKLKQLKKAMLNKMFPKDGANIPQIRFKGSSGKWEEKKLGELTKITTGSSNREDSGIDGKYTFFDRSDDVRKSDIYLFNCEAVIVAGEGSDFVPKYFMGKFDLHQRTYAIMNYDNGDMKFLFYYIHLFRKYFFNQAVGSTVKSLRLPMFQEMPIKFPKIDEQIKIGNYFQKLDKLIELQKKEIEKLNNIKKASLDKMFV